MKKVISVLIVIAGAILMAFGAAAETVKNTSLGIIGGADGPTAVFVAGKLGDGSGIGILIVGILLIGTGVLIFRKRKG